MEKEEIISEMLFNIKKYLLQVQSCVLELEGQLKKDREE